jgi:hypothetical protein
MYKSSFYWKADEPYFTNLRRFLALIEVEILFIFAIKNEKIATDSRK